MAASVESAEGDLGFQIAPMIDVVFVLMLFFMAVSGAQVMTKELHVPLARHGGGSDTVVVLDIATDGGVLFNGEPIGLPHDSQLAGLRARFQHILQEFGDKDLVFLRPESSVAHQRIMEVLTAVQASGVQKLGFL